MNLAEARAEAVDLFVPAPDNRLGARSLRLSSARPNGSVPRKPSPGIAPPVRAWVASPNSPTCVNRMSSSRGADVYAAIAASADFAPMTLRPVWTLCCTSTPVTTLVEVVSAIVTVPRPPVVLRSGFIAEYIMPGVRRL